MFCSLSNILHVSLPEFFTASIVVMIIMILSSLAHHSLMCGCCCSGADDQCRGSSAVCQGGSDLHHRAHPAGVDPHGGQQAPHATGDCRDVLLPASHTRTHTHTRCSITRCVPPVCPPRRRHLSVHSKREPSRVSVTHFSCSSCAVTRSSRLEEVGEEVGEETAVADNWTHLDAVRPEPPSRT